MSEINDLAGRRVLIVEDEAMVCMMIEDMVSELGCVVVGPAGNLTQALALTDEQIDIAILDVNLNGEPSGAVADRLIGRGVPFVFATGYGRSQLEGSYKGILVIKKPFDHEELAKALATALQTSTGAPAKSGTTPQPVLLWM